MSLLRALAAVWRVGEDQVQLYTSLSKPSLQTSPSEATIGRAVLPVLTLQAKQPSLTSATNSNKVQQSHVLSTPYLSRVGVVHWHGQPRSYSQLGMFPPMDHMMCAP